MEVKIEKSWQAILQDEFDKPYFNLLTNFVRKEYQTKTIYPPAKLIFNAFDLTSFDNVKVVIIGQDPYHEIGQAHGLSFSVQPGIAIPPSLKNIYKELHDDLGCYIPNNGFLEKWAKQGVLLLNNVLTVREGQANSHKDCGWETFTDRVIVELNKREKPIVFMFWGANAKKKEMLVTNKNHLILKAAHPSPLSAFNGFFGCKHFSRANDFLKNNDFEPIDWQIENI
jgi:uracil-DNA glycosylase